NANDDELAFVLGHEVGHVAARHSVKRLQFSMGMGLVVSIALRDPDYELVKSAVNIAYDVVAKGYSRGDEFLADSLGLKYAYRAGYSPQGAIALLQKLKKKNDMGSFLVFLRSHPPA
ncbi:MAG: M48 family metalloprotease, partial [Candidatus Omnitrophota bacterium]